jgi:hypothetical protein
LVLTNLSSPANYSCKVASNSNCMVPTSNSVNVSIFVAAVFQNPSDYAWTSAEGSHLQDFSVSGDTRSGDTYGYSWKCQTTGAAQDCADTRYFPNGFGTATLTVNLPYPSYPLHIWCHLTDRCGNTVDTSHATITETF